jgi:hypothetical protein
MFLNKPRYIKKLYFKLISKNSKKKINNSFFKNKNNKKNNFFFEKKHHLNPIFFKTKYENSLMFSYLTYQNNIFSLKKKFNNIKYTKILDLIKNKKIKTSRILKSYTNFFKIFKIKFIINFVIIYRFFFYSIYIDIFFFLRFLKLKNILIYFLILSFKKKKLFINLKNLKKKNFLSLSTGLFIKFFEKKKSIKKNKAIKLLMAKYLRKLFIISKIKNIILIIKKTPVFLNEIINFFNLPIAHKFLNPIDQKAIEESFNDSLTIKFLYFIFMENKNFSKNKAPQKGRIKRKILRKITFENKIID